MARRALPVLVLRASQLVNSSGQACSVFEITLPPFASSSHLPPGAVLLVSPVSCVDGHEEVIRTEDPQVSQNTPGSQRNSQPSRANSNRCMPLVLCLVLLAVTQALLAGRFRPCSISTPDRRPP